MNSRLFVVREEHTNNSLALIKIEACQQGFELALYQVRQKKLRRYVLAEPPDDLARWVQSLEPPT